MTAVICRFRRLAWVSTCPSSIRSRIRRGGRGRTGARSVRPDHFHRSSTDKVLWIIVDPYHWLKLCIGPVHHRRDGQRMGRCPSGSRPASGGGEGRARSCGPGASGRCRSRIGGANPDGGPASGPPASASPYARWSGAVRAVLRGGWCPPQTECHAGLILLPHRLPARIRPRAACPSEAGAARPRPGLRCPPRPPPPGSGGRRHRGSRGRARYRARDRGRLRC